MFPVGGREEAESGPAPKQVAETERGEGEGGRTRATWDEEVTVLGSSDHRDGPTRPRGVTVLGSSDHRDGPPRGDAAAAIYTATTATSQHHAARRGDATRRAATARGTQ